MRRALFRGARAACVVRFLLEALELDRLPTSDRKRARECAVAEPSGVGANCYEGAYRTAMVLACGGGSRWGRGHLRGRGSWAAARKHPTIRTRASKPLSRMT